MCLLLFSSSPVFTCLVDTVFLRATCRNEKGMLRKRGFLLGWERLRDFCFYLSVSLGQALDCSPQGTRELWIQTWGCMITNKLPVIQHLLVLSLIWIGGEKSIVKSKNEKTISGSRKKGCCQVYWAAARNTRCGSVRKLDKGIPGTKVKVWNCWETREGIQGDAEFLPGHIS